MIIAIEGMDAAGKKTQSEMLAKRFGATRFAFPNYESPTGKLILSHLKKEWFCAEEDDDAESVQHYRPASDTLDARVFQSLQAVNRLELLPEIKTAAANGQHVVFDRYWQSGYVYGSLDGLEETWLRLVQETSVPPADINILIDVSVDEGFRRRPERRDRYEADRLFLERVRVKYRELWGVPGTLVWRAKETRPGWYVVSGFDHVDEVHSNIFSIVDAVR